jgi:hypothetical protein
MKMDWASLSITIRRDGAPVEGKVRAIQEVEGINSSYNGREGFAVLLWKPMAALEPGASYVLEVKPPEGTASEVNFKASPPLGAVAVPTDLEVKISEARVPDYVCCEGASGCGSGVDTEPYPGTSPVEDPIPPSPSSSFCVVAHERDVPRFDFSFSLPPQEVRPFFTFELFDQDQPAKVLAAFPCWHSRLQDVVKGTHAMLAEGAKTCVGLRVVNIATDEKAETSLCSELPASAPDDTTNCAEAQERSASCPNSVHAESNKKIMSQHCSGNPGGQGGGSQDGSPQAGGTQPNGPQGQASIGQGDGCSVIAGPSQVGGGLLGLALACAVLRRPTRRR